MTVQDILDAEVEGEEVERGCSDCGTTNQKHFESPDDIRCVQCNEVLDDIEREESDDDHGED